jgi:hypothetical protein
MADRLNPAFQEDAAVEEERAIVEAYAAAEHAYFAALVRVVGDPSFTEAVRGRRGPRPPAAPPPAVPVPGLEQLGVPDERPAPV